MKKLLQKISWKTTRLNLKIKVLDILLHDHQEAWGFNLFCITHNFRDYSLLRFEFRLPNGTHIRKFTVDYWDFMFISRFLWKIYDELSDRYLWSFRDPTGWDKFRLYILGKLFK